MYTVVFHPQPRQGRTFRWLRYRYRGHINYCSTIPMEKKLVNRRQRELGKRMSADEDGLDWKGFRLHTGWCD